VKGVDTVCGIAVVASGAKQPIRRQLHRSRAALGHVAWLVMTVWDGFSEALKRNSYQTRLGETQTLPTQG
jgi:hypothetical protein